MDISGIGIQQILARTGIGSQVPNPTPNPPNDDGGDKASSQTVRSVPAPGIGGVVDKTA